MVLRRDTHRQLQELEVLRTLRMNLCSGLLSLVTCINADGTQDRAHGEDLLQLHDNMKTLPKGARYHVRRVKEMSELADFRDQMET